MAEIPKSYTIVDLDPDGLELCALAMNDHGSVCGTVSDTVKTVVPFLLRDGELIRLEDKGEEQTRALALNNDDLVVGGAKLKGKEYPCAWRNGRFEWIEQPLVGCPGHARAVNNRGEIAGMTGAHIVGAEPWEPAVWFRGMRIDLDLEGIEPWEGWLLVQGMNDNGAVIGYVDDTAFCWNAGETTVLTFGRSARMVLPTGINRDGVITGWVIRNRQSATAVVCRSGRAERLFPTAIYDSETADINDDGLIVGEFRQERESPVRGFVWCDGEFANLNERLSSPGDFVIERPVAINNPGQILARAKRGDEDTLVLLTPTG